MQWLELRLIPPLFLLQKKYDGIENTKANLKVFTTLGKIAKDKLLILVLNKFQKFYMKNNHFVAIIISTVLLLSVTLSCSKSSSSGTTYTTPPTSGYGNTVSIAFMSFKPATIII